MPLTVSTPLAIANGRLYICLGYYYTGMWVMALDANTGQGLWTNRLASAFCINPLTVADGAVFVQWSEGVQPSRIWSFDAVTGLTNWSTEYTSQGSTEMAPMVVDGTVYVNTGRYSGLTGYDERYGYQWFFVSTLGGLGCHDWTPTYCSDNGQVYTWVNGFFIEHDPWWGAINWVVTNGTPNEFVYSMNRTVAITNNRAYFTGTSKLFCVDLAGHTNAWSVNGSFSYTPAVANGRVYVISNYVINAYTTNGVFVRTYAGPPSGGFYGQFIVTDDVLIAANVYGVYIFRLSDAFVQQYISSYRTNSGFYYGSRIGLASNTLYVASSDGIVFAYTPTATTPITLTGATRLGNGAFQLSFTNIPGATFIARASTNLAWPSTNWPGLGTVTQYAAGQYRFTDFGATNWPRRYYRISTP